jgi:hypothetical protein
MRPRGAGTDALVLRLARAVSIAAASSAAFAACSGSEGGTDRPNTGIRPMAALAFRFRNNTGAPIYVDVTGGAAHFVLRRDGVEVRIELGCLPSCGSTCACTACPTSDFAARRIAAGQELTSSWTPVRYVVRPCGAESACQCGEVWPVTAGLGSYEVSLAGTRAIRGGTPDPSDPDLVRGAVLDSTSIACKATATFVMDGGARVLANFECE